MKAAPKPREVIGSKRFRCDTKNGKKCEAISIRGFFGNNVRCKYCNKLMQKGR